MSVSVWYSVCVCMVECLCLYGKVSVSVWYISESSLASCLHTGNHTDTDTGSRKHRVLETMDTRVEVVIVTAITMPRSKTLQHAYDGIMLIIMTVLFPHCDLIIRLGSDSCSVRHTHTHTHACMHARMHSMLLNITRADPPLCADESRIP